jgi:hypothetical protein
MDQAPGDLERRAWWQERRLRYNIGLVAAGAVAFVAYAAIISLAPVNALAPGEEPPEFTVFTAAFQAVGSAAAMVVANVCYGLGAGVERLVTPKDARAFRRTAFTLGFAFSIALPFTVPAAVLWNVLTAP